MGSLRFPFSLPQPPKPPTAPALRQVAAAAAAIGAGTGLAISISLERPAAAATRSESSSTTTTPCSLAGGLPPATGFVEPIPGVPFPTVLYGRRRLVGAGAPPQQCREKMVSAGCNIHYRPGNNFCCAFGVYADENDIKRLSGKYGKLSVSELKENKQFISDVIDQDLCLTVRLRIVYNRLSIASVRNAFTKSVGTRIQKFSGEENKELLQRFTSLFKDEYKLPKGSVIDLSRDRDHVLQIKIDGKDIGNIQSKLLCKSVLDLYMGDEPFDKRAKEEIQSGLASLLQEKSN